MITIWKTWTGGPAAAPVASPQSPGPGMGPGQWHPTILYMIVLVIAEIFAVALLSRTLLR